MTARTVAVVLACASALAGCSARADASLTVEEREEAVHASAHAPRAFTFVRTSGTEKVSVAGEVEDDYRYRATMSFGDRAAYEEVVVDDRRAIRVVDGSALPGPVRTNPALAPLLAGTWTEDAAKAPPEFPRPGDPPRLLDPSAVLDKVRYLERAEQGDARARLVRSAALYDPRSTRYLKRHDKFPRHEEDGVRYDTVPGPYDGDLLFRETIPADLEQHLEASFLYVSWWFRDGRVTRVELLFDVDVEAVLRDMTESALRQAQRVGIPVESVPLVPRPYRETYTFRYPAAPIEVELPPVAGSIAFPVVDTARQGATP